MLCHPQSACSIEPSASHLDSLLRGPFLAVKRRLPAIQPPHPGRCVSPCLPAVWALCHPHIPRVNLSHVDHVWLVSLVFLFEARLSNPPGMWAFLVPFPHQLPPGPDEFHHACLKSSDFQFANLILVLQNFGNPAKPGARCRFNEHIFSSFFPVSMKMLRGTGSGVAPRRLLLWNTLSCL